jgi:uncharacterized protein YggU (UPF0235/DUF167 family)
MTSNGSTGDVLNVMIWVKPGGKNGLVGGRRGDALVVRVQARAVDGNASEAALRAVADAFSLPPARVRLVHGTRTRSKMVALAGDPTELTYRLRALLARTE